MIVVTGTKRSGTSLWMQILRAAGLPSIGEAFPADWRAAYGDANPEGFFESQFREGVNFTNNPDPKTGLYLHSADVPLHAIKIFVPGLTKTDLAFVERVVAGVRDVREYDASVRALDALDDARALRRADVPPALHATPYLEWWRDNYALVVDTMTRRYPMRAVALDELVAAPEARIREVLTFLGTGDVARATEAVKPSLRRSDTTAFLVRQYERFGRVSRARIVTPNVYVFGPDANRLLMVTRRHDFSYRLGYGGIAVGRLFADSIMLVDGDDHARMRAILEPAVGPVAMAQYVALVQGVWDRWLARSNGTRAHDVYELALAATYEAAAAALLGLDRTPELDAVRASFTTLIRGAKAWVPLRVPGSVLDCGLRARSRLIDALSPLVAEARTKPARGMLGLLAHHHDERGDALPDDGVVAHRLMLFWAGYDTTASAGSWALHMLAEHPTVQEELRDEAFRVLGERPYASDDQAKLVKLGCFLRELERHCPSVLVFPRVTTEDVEIDGHAIPKGTPVTWSPYMTHRLPELYENPHAVRRYRVEPDPTSRWRTAMVPVHHPSGYRVRLVRLSRAGSGEC